MGMLMADKFKLIVSLLIFCLVENHDSQAIFCLYIYWSEKVDTLWFSRVQSVKALKLNKNMLCELNFTILNVKFVQFLLVCTIFHSNYACYLGKRTTQ